MTGLIYLDDGEKYPLQLIIRSLLIQTQMEGKRCGKHRVFVSAAESGRIHQLRRYYYFQFACSGAVSLPAKALYQGRSGWSCKRLTIG